MTVGRYHRQEIFYPIGKEGQNARLAARLTGYKIDIKAESDADALDFDMEPVEELPADEPETEERISE